jgi:AcrR family transcriptional regulator
MPRKYDGSRRAEAARRTHDHIVSTAFRLHGEGVVDIETLAKEAAVSLPTVRKHFPTREILFQSCTAYGLHLASMPDPRDLERAADPGERTELAVRQVYSMHEFLLGQIWIAFQMENESPTLATTVRQYQELVSQVADVVIRAWPIPEARQHVARGQTIAMLSPLTDRALRISGGLSPEDAISQISTLLATALKAEAAQEEVAYLR